MATCTITRPAPLAPSRRDQPRYKLYVRPASVGGRPKLFAAVVTAVAEGRRAAVLQGRQRTAYGLLRPDKLIVLLHRALDDRRPGPND